MTDLVRDVAAEVRPPDFETLVRRASRRRTRRRAAAVGSVAVLVAAGAAGIALLRPSEEVDPVPTHPSPSPHSTPTPHDNSTSGPSGVAAVVERGTLSAYAVDPDGVVFTHWQWCPSTAGSAGAADETPCEYAYRIAAPDGSTVTASATQADAPIGVPGGFVDAPWNSPPLLFREQSAVNLRHVETGSIGSHTVVVAGRGKGTLLAVDPAAATIWPISGSCRAGQQGWIGATVSSLGVLWAMPQPDGAANAPIALCSSTDGRTWHVDVPAMSTTEGTGWPGLVVTSGGRVEALVTSASSATVMPVGPMWTNVGGRWRRIPAPPFTSVDSMAATSGGVLFVASGDGSLYRSTDWRTFTRDNHISAISDLNANGATVTGLVSPTFQNPAQDYPRLVIISGSGSAKPWPTALR